MFRDLLSGRVVLAALVFFVVVVVGSQLYSWHIRRTTQAEWAASDALKHHRESQNETHTTQNTVDTSTVDFERSRTALETDTTQPMFDDTDVSPIDKTSEVLDLSDAFLPDDFVSEAEIAEDVPVSPFGFGPYPEVPEGFPENLMPVWTWSEERQQEQLEGLENFELMGRVLIKLWNQGGRDFVGVTRSDSNGKVYPLYKDLVYVDRWTELPVKGGRVALFPAGQLSGNLSAGAEEMLSIETFVESGGQLPPEIQFVDFETEGINPYDYLNLK